MYTHLKDLRSHVGKEPEFTWNTLLSNTYIKLTMWSKIKPLFKLWQLQPFRIPP